MCKTLNFRIGERDFDLAPTKVERKKLYGWTETQVTTSDGQVCRQAGLDRSGKIIIPKGAIKIGCVANDGQWVDKSQFVAVHADGQRAESIASSFDMPITLDNKATAEQLLDLRVTAVYQLSGESIGELNSMLSDEIYTFPFSYRGGLRDLHSLSANKWHNAISNHGRANDV
ncbi:MAG: hypothetical protein IJX65_07000 [Alistipes sp.]|nr:hypothetical protein [Alistipes sp.]